LSHKNCRLDFQHRVMGWMDIRTLSFIKYNNNLEEKNCLCCFF
jgi:hypothetical protein